MTSAEMMTKVAVLPQFVVRLPHAPLMTKTAIRSRRTIAVVTISRNEMLTPATRAEEEINPTVTMTATIIVKMTIVIDGTIAQPAMTAAETSTPVKQTIVATTPVSPIIAAMARATAAKTRRKTIVAPLVPAPRAVELTTSIMTAVVLRRVMCVGMTIVTIQAAIHVILATVVTIIATRVTIIAPKPATTLAIVT